MSAGDVGVPSSQEPNTINQPGRDGLDNQDNSSCPSDKINLKLIWVSGKSSDFIVPYMYTAGQVTEYIFNNWPEEWAAEKENVSSHQVLRLIYQGRFLHDNVTFLALNILPGKKIVMHLVPREKLPQITSEDLQINSKATERSCCCVII